MKPLIRPDVLRLTLPVLFEQLFVQLLGTLNTIMASRLGRDAVSAIGMVDSINSVINALLSALAIGATVVVAQSVGRGNRLRAGAGASHALLAAGAFACVVALLLILARGPMLHLLYHGIDTEVMAHMETYLAISALAFPLTALTVVGCGALRGAGETASTMKVNTLINILNVVFSYVLTYGVQLPVGPFQLVTPAFGVAGAAAGLTLARLGGVLYLVRTLRQQRQALPLGRMREWRFAPTLLHAVFAVGIPASLESLVFNGGKLVVQVFIVGMGTVAIASNYIAFSISNLINIPGAALAVSLTTLVGHDAGRGDYTAARRTMWHVLRIAWACMAVIGVLFIPLAPSVVGLYSTDPGVIDTAPCWCA